MSYDVNIINWNLIRTDTSKSIDDIDELFLDWKEVDDNKIKPTENYSHWADEFINDLIKLARIDVVGEIVIMSEEGEYTKFALADNEVKEYDGIIIYEKMSHEIHTELK